VTLIGSAVPGHPSAMPGGMIPGAPISVSVEPAPFVMPVIAHGPSSRRYAQFNGLNTTRRGEWGTAHLKTVDYAS
jgi:hypothetical protein